MELISDSFAYQRGCSEEAIEKEVNSSPLQGNMKEDVLVSNAEIMPL